MSKQHTHYFVTDIETDGPDPAMHSMLSFATVVLRDDGTVLGEFEAVLEPRKDRAQDPQTMEWWKSQPEAWAETTNNPQPPSAVMSEFVSWVISFPEHRSFAARPLLFDGIWMDRYLRDFANSFVLDMRYWDNPSFTSAALDIPTYLAGLFDRSRALTFHDKIPADWLGNHQHTHCAIDDARGYASLLANAFEIANSMPRHSQDFTDIKI